MAEITIRSVTKEYPNGHVAVDGVDLDVADGELLVLVGPSGCGKSTLLRMVAGLEEVTAGQIAIGGRDVTDAAPKDRDIAMVFQSYALYPNRTVRGNIAYPLKLAKLPSHEIDRRVAEAARLLQLESVLDRRPAQLSGGQRQRVAMGRAIVRQPYAFLMDEPLSNLDAKLRVQMRAEIARLQRDLGVTTIYVTHDQVEAMTMGSRVAVLHGGRIQQVDTPRALYERPVNLFVAGFMGSPPMNLYRARLSADGDATSAVFGRHRLPLDERLATRPEIRAWVGREVVLGIRPEALEDASFDADAPPERVIELRVELVEALGAELLVHSAIDATTIQDGTSFDSAEEAPGSAMLVARLSPRSRIEAGDTVKLTVDTAQLHLFDPASGLALADAGPPAPA
ncbi:MAG TPA: sn-glycerol-3-phosphate ABC transporter ATP-binding protein UgpC [Acidimicrobiales bacterium]